MLDLLISHPATCEKCGCEGECIRVDFWDHSFYGLLCWIDLMKLVRAKSEDPMARKKFAAMRPQTGSDGTTETQSKEVTETKSKEVNKSHTTSRSEGVFVSISEERSKSISLGVSWSRGVTTTTTEVESKQES